MKTTQAIALTFVVLMMHAAPSQACTCAQWPTVDEALERSAAVYSGKVLDIRTVETTARWMIKEVDFARIDAWKGPEAGHITIETAESDASCGYPFEIGEEYLVYAYSYPGDTVLNVSLCSRTRLLAWANEDLKDLGTPIYSVSVESATWATVKRLFKDD